MRFQAWERIPRLIEHAACRPGRQRNPMDFSFGLPLVAETWNGFLNDINGYHARSRHVH
jgi:hypothetical protein